MCTRLRAGALLLAALLLLPAPTLAALSLGPPRPATGVYCTPVAFRDYVVAIGYQAVVRAAPGCTRPAKVRKENALSGSVIGQPNVVPVGEIKYVWLFTHRLKYTLDDRTWQRLAVR
ncbi:hypothetical protein [Deinococcus navajonensis]|uniref:Uncharacterized protein n=1 Tax=Deinococcus navajonensis TaxID=309884 RepID=A0ABV8XRA0_9DEIO